MVLRTIWNVGRMSPVPKASQTLVYCLAVGVSALAGPTAGIASIGGRASAIETDRAHFVASMKSETIGTVSVHTLSPQNGGTISEYSDSNGTVFAVRWAGPGRPDLRQLLGDRFDTMAAMPRTRGRHTRRALVLQRSNLVIHSMGHPGAFFGFAYDPALVPAGVSIDALP
jgi:hypothetical protein